jgi:hypothetical protein
MGRVLRVLGWLDRLTSQRRFPGALRTPLPKGPYATRARQAV